MKWLAIGVYVLFGAARALARQGRGCRCGGNWSTSRPSWRRMNVFMHAVVARAETALHSGGRLPELAPLTRTGATIRAEAESG